MSDRQPGTDRFSAPNSQPSPVISVKWAYRWEVYRRLKNLGIDCRCATNEPLLVDLYSPTTLIQIWSVIRQSNAERQQLVDWLNNCWYIPYDHNGKTSGSNSHDQRQ
ncbi:MAG: Asr1405/Asl0597 family protein [Cyanobacteria bacterium J06621_8]